jgi:uncharacterized membrane protein
MAQSLGGIKMANQVTKSIIVNGNVDELYETWADFSNYPQFMEHITSVRQNGLDTNHWVMEGPLNTKLEWTTKTTRMEPEKRIAWKTIDGDLKTSGQVTFNELPKGQVEVTVISQVIPPDNLLEKAALALFQDEDGQLEKDLRSFKAMVENRSEQHSHTR